MSVELKCDRCKTQTTVAPSVTDASVGTIVRNANLPNGWGTVQVAKFNQPAMTKHLCDGCRGDLVRFMTGTEIPRKAMPGDKTVVLQHEPLPNCRLAWDPEVNGGKGGLICAHDQPHRVRFLLEQKLDEAEAKMTGGQKLAPGAMWRGVHAAEITGEVFNPGTGRALKRDDDPELFDALVMDMKALGASECMVCQVETTRLGVLIHMRQAHPDGADEPEPCGGCLHPVHLANKCPESGECWCDEGLPACTCDHNRQAHGEFGCGYLGGCKCKWVLEDGEEGPVERMDREYVNLDVSAAEDRVANQLGMCRMCRHPKHGTTRCLSKKTMDEGGKCPCVGALEDQLSNMPSQRSAPIIESADE